MKENIKRFLEEIEQNGYQFRNELKSELLVEKNENEIKNRFIQLKIVLNSFSPVYKTIWGEKYREQIDINCFDYETPIEKQELFSYVDHDISIEKMIATTKNGSMNVEKKDNEIIATIKVDESDPIAKKTADLIQNGAITSNSFIFQPIEVETREFNEENENGIDFEIIFKKGKLISIDPVYKGFYPQCETSIQMKGKKEMSTENQELETKVEKTEELKVETKVEKTENQELETKVEKTEEPKVEVKVEKASKEEIDEILNLRAQAIANSLKKELNAPKKELNAHEIVSKWEQKVVLNSEEQDFLMKEYNSLNEDWKRSVSMTMGTNDVNSQLVQRSLDGSSKANGLALIETLQNKRILTEWMTIFPELSEYAQIIPIVGLNKMQQSILIPDKTSVTKLAEGAASQKQGGKTTNVMFEPDRYSVEINQNNAINNFNVTFQSQTDTVKDNIKTTLRKALYDNMFENIGTTLNVDSYTGGATSESVVQTKEVGKLTILDVDNIVKELISKWGDWALNQYVISMHRDVLTHLENEYFTSGSTLWKDIYDPITRKFRGIQIILSDYMPDKEIVTGKNVLIFWLKSSIVAYGCSIVTQDNPYEKMSEDQASRFVKTRGQIKMCDPNLNTRVLQIK